MVWHGALYLSKCSAQVLPLYLNHYLESTCWKHTVSKVQQTGETQEVGAFSFSFQGFSDLAASCLFMPFCFHICSQFSCLFFFHAVMLISKVWGQLSGVVVDGKSGSEALRCRAAMVVWCATNPPRHRFGRAKIRAHHKAYHKTTRCIPELVLCHHTNSAKFAGFLQAS